MKRLIGAVVLLVLVVRRMVDYGYDIGYEEGYGDGELDTLGKVSGR